MNTYAILYINTISELMVYSFNLIYYRFICINKYILYYRSLNIITESAKDYFVIKQCTIYSIHCTVYKRIIKLRNKISRVA